MLPPRSPSAASPARSRSPQPLGCCRVRRRATGPTSLEDAAVLVSARCRGQGDPPALQQRFMAERANATIEEVPASHVSFVSQPEAATQLILQAVEATAKAL